MEQRATVRQVVGGERLRCLVAHTGSGVTPEVTHQSQEGDAGAGEGGHVETVGRQVLMGRGVGGWREEILRQRWQ